MSGVFVGLCAGLGDLLGWLRVWCFVIPGVWVIISTWGCGIFGVFFFLVWCKWVLV